MPVMCLEMHNHYVCYHNENKLPDLNENSRNLSSLFMLSFHVYLFCSLEFLFVSLQIFYAYDFSNFLSQSQLRFFFLNLSSADIWLYLPKMYNSNLAYSVILSPQNDTIGRTLYEVWTELLPNQEGCMRDKF